MHKLPKSKGAAVALPVSTAASGDSVLCRVELRDGGRADRLVAATVVRMTRVN